MNVRSVLALSLAISAILPHLPAQEEAEPSKPNRRGAGGTPACVWKIEGERNTVYLAGSMHLLREEDLPLPRPFLRAFRNSTRLVFEIAPEEEGSPKAARLSLEKGTYGDGKKLSDEISEEAYTEVAGFLEKAGMPAGSFDQFRPWMGAMTITMAEMMRIGALPQFGVEKVLEGLANEAGKEIDGLETLEFQLGLFGGLEPKLQERMLVESVREAGTLGDEFPKMVAAWRVADEKAFEESAFDDKDDPEVRAFYEVVLYGRNREWIGKIEALLKEDENVMVVVGAGHLLGQGSVVELLRAKGHKITRMKEGGKGRPREPKPEMPKPEPEPEREENAKERDLVPVLDTAASLPR